MVKHFFHTFHCYKQSEKASLFAHVFQHYPSTRRIITGDVHNFISLSFWMASDRMLARSENIQISLNKTFIYVC